MLTLQTASYAIADRLLFKEVSFQIGPHQHVGLIGRNGTGKTTLFKVIQGLLLADQGEVSVAKQWRVLAVNQEMPAGHLTPLEHLLAQDSERLALLNALEVCADPNRLAGLYERLIQIDAYSAEARAATVLKGLGFDDAAQQRLLSTFSGGFRMRVALGAALFQQPDLLLLDEPTNHLDLETIAWLKKFLLRYPKSFLLISHDRDFLNHTVSHILHLKNAKVERYSGNFDTFLTTYQMQQKNIVAHNSKLKAQREHMMDFVQRNRARASKAKQAQSRLKAIEKLQFIPVESDDATVKLQFPQPEAVAPPLISFSKVVLGYQDKIVLNLISGALNPGDRIAVVGANGQGKTTLARFLAGQLSAKKGLVTTHRKLKIAFYQQEQAQAFTTECTVYSHISDQFKQSNDRQIRTHLGRFGFSGERVLQKVSELSGGEKARLLFAGLTAECPNLLILDEPTNHLDMEMRESLIKALNEYQGAIILISHDRHLLQHVADRLWLIDKGTLVNFTGDLLEYEQSLRKRG